MQPNFSGRRRILQSAGVTLALPFFESLPFVGQPSTVAAADSESMATPLRQRSSMKKNLVCVGNMLGFHPEAFWPKSEKPPGDSGLTIDPDFKWGRSTSALDSVRQNLTLIEGLDHGTKGGHFSIHTFLSGVKQIDAKSMPLGNVTIDQYAAEEFAGETRFPSLTIGSESGIHGGCQLSWTRTGTRVPPIPGPEQLFKLLFIKSNEKDKTAAVKRFQLQASILDLVRDEAHSYKKKLNKKDQSKLEEYLSSVRDVEKRIAMKKNWVDVPKPKAPFEPPKNRNMVQDLPLLYDLIVLALQTDSTHIATLEIGGDFNPRDLGVRGGYHALSHHGKLKEKIESLIKLESYQLQQFARFISKLNKVEGKEGGSLLDQTMVLFGSGMGNANSHTNTRLPVILAGGDYSHGNLLKFDPKNQHRPPLTNLFVSLLQKLGMEVDQFSTSSGTLKGLV